MERARRSLPTTGDKSGADSRSDAPDASDVHLTAARIISPQRTGRAPSIPVHIPRETAPPKKCVGMKKKDRSSPFVLPCLFTSFTFLPPFFTIAVRGSMPSGANKRLFARSGGGGSTSASLASRYIDRRPNGRLFTPGRSRVNALQRQTTVSNRENGPPRRPAVRRECPVIERKALSKSGRALPACPVYIRSIHK